MRKRYFLPSRMEPLPNVIRTTDEYKNDDPPVVQQRTTVIQNKTQHFTRQSTTDSPATSTLGTTASSGSLGSLISLPKICGLRKLASPGPRWKTEFWSPGERFFE